MNFVNDFNIQELDTDAVFLEKARTMYRYSITDLMMLTEDFKNKNNLNFFVGKNKAEIFDNFIKSAKGIVEFNKAATILEKIVYSDNVEMAYKKQVVLAFARFIHTIRKYVKSADESQINGSYLMCVRYFVKQKEIDAINQIFDVHYYVVSMIEKTSWANEALVWMFEETAKLFISVNVEQLAKTKSVKYGSLVDRSSSAIMTLYKASPGNIIVPDEELLKKTLVHNDAVRAYAQSSKASYFFGTTDTHLFTSSLACDDMLELLYIQDSKAIETLFVITKEDVLIAMGSTRSSSSAETFRYAVKAKIVKRMLENRSQIIFDLIQEDFVDFKAFLKAVLPKVESITKAKDEEGGEVFFKSALNGYVGRDSHYSCSPKYSTSLRLFQTFASVEDVAEVMSEIGCIGHENFKMPYFWNSMNKSVSYVSVINPSQFLKCDVIEGNEDKLIESILKNGGSESVCGEIFAYRATNLNRMIPSILFDNETIYDTKATKAVKELDDFFGKFKKNLKSFNISVSMIANWNIMALVVSDAINVLEFLKEKNSLNFNVSGIIRDVFPYSGKFGVMTTKNVNFNSLEVLGKFISWGLIDKKTIVDEIDIPRGVDYKLLSLNDVKEKLLKVPSISVLSNALDFFTEALINKKEIRFAKEAIEFMLGSEVSQYIDKTFTHNDKVGLKEWRESVEKTLLNSGKLLSFTSSDVEKEEKLQSMFLKHFGVKL